jgi:hypothetical protein
MHRLFAFGEVHRHRNLMGWAATRAAGRSGVVTAVPLLLRRSSLPAHGTTVSGACDANQYGEREVT